MIYILVMYLISAVISFRLFFRMVRAIRPKEPLFTPQDIADWDARWLFGDTVVSVMAAFLGPVGIIMALVGRRDTTR